jgi:hypothetical protein
MDDPDDLVVLAADNQMQEALRGILSRPRALAIASISFTVFSHPEKDPGCRQKAHEFLRNLRSDYRHGLVLFDYEGCGASHISTPSEITSDVEERLHRSGWENQARCVVIDPELEVWVWADSSKVDDCLGWSSSSHQLRDWLREKDHWPPDVTKPPAPKDAMEDALREARLPHSSSIFRELAESVSLRGCEDEAFQRFRRILQEWFPPSWKQ